jgi:formyl-CoA transferase
VAANKQEQFEALCRVIGCPGLAADPRFAERQARLTHRAELAALLEEAFAAEPADAWWPRLTAAGVPAGPVYSVRQALEQPQVAGRGMLATFADVPGVGRDLRVVRTGIRLDGAPPAVDTPPPRLGEHTDAILSELGYDAEEIARLKAQRTV